MFNHRHGGTVSTQQLPPLSPAQLCTSHVCTATPAWQPTCSVCAAVHSEQLAHMASARNRVARGHAHRAVPAACRALFSVMFHHTHSWEGGVAANPSYRGMIRGHPNHKAILMWKPRPVATRATHVAVSVVCGHKPVLEPATSPTGYKHDKSCTDIVLVRQA